MPNVSTSYDVFLSRHSEDKPAVEALALRLREARTEPFLEKMICGAGSALATGARGRSEGVDGDRRLQGQRLGPWHHQEMQTALASAVQNQKPVIPVLLLGVDRAEVPTFLAYEPGSVSEPAHRARLPL